jgi:outer membrane protein assembly factor BamB
MLTALDQNTGATLWTFGPLPTTQTVFNAYAFYGSPAVAGGKLYICTTEHTPTQPRIKGNLFYCIDTTTGKEVWHMLGAINSVVVAEGYILGTNENDGLLYAYGKGQTETTVATSQTQISKGQSVGITGTVLDLSPAQPSTPCVSSASMSDWMNYQHMQVPLASEPTGVQVTLTATKSDGTTINIGTATSNSKGIFGIMWTPPDTGIYTVTAKFTGDDSYWSSEASTAQTVVATSASQAPTTTVSPSVAPPPSSEAPSMTLYIALAGVAVAIIIIAAVALVIKRRK